jgi:hypothetical protein
VKDSKSFVSKHYLLLAHCNISKHSIFSLLLDLRLLSLNSSKHRSLIHVCDSNLPQKVSYFITECDGLGKCLVSLKVLNHMKK